MALIPKTAPSLWHSSRAHWAGQRAERAGYYLDRLARLYDLTAREGNPARLARVQRAFARVQAIRQYWARQAIYHREREMATFSRDIYGTTTTPTKG